MAFSSVKSINLNFSKTGINLISEKLKSKLAKKSHLSTIRAMQTGA